MLFFTPQPGHKLNWEVRNSQDGSEDNLPFIVIERPMGSANPTVRGVALRHSKDGSQEYLQIVTVPERFLSLRKDIVEAIDGPADAPYTLNDLAEKLVAQETERKASQVAAATIAS